MKKTLKSILILVILFLLLVLYLINAQELIKNTIDYSTMFLSRLFPVSFLFFVFSYLFLEYGLLDILSFYLNIKASSLYVFILSMISGFPSGAKYTKDMYLKNYLTKEEACSALWYTHFPNPLFVLGSVNLVLKNYSLSIKILLSIIISNFIIYLFSKKEKNSFKKNISYPNSFSSVLSNAIQNSFQTIIIIYGTSLFFYLVSWIITRYLSLNTYLFVLLNGIFDLTKGVFSTSLLSNTIIKSFFILFFISIGGLSIHMQVMSILSDTDISYYSYFKGRIIGVILSFLVFFILLLI